MSDAGPAPDLSAPPGGGPSAIRDAFLAKIRAERPMFYGTVVAQARRIDVDENRITFRFGPAQTMLSGQVGQQRALLETFASAAAGRRMSVVAEVAADAAAPDAGAGGSDAPAPAERTRDLRAEALKDPVVQSLLDVIPSELRDVTEREDP